MTIGAVYCELLIYDAQSLKDKRSVLKSLITRIKQRFNVSVAEIGHQNVWQRSEIAVVTVSANKNVAEQEIDRVLSFIDRMTELERTVTNYEWL
ncbi:MAG: DUF503 domain-containing protein [Bacillaceae bacterium]|uniref:DUF503 domain-containing protein n=1 Tax=Alkalihalobacterium chitinilyticum TaxID=2980103 RepID=A0ABT5VBT8_9BACI|nr:DUF503 domain-containing protein [Alkalihalobacterium chitinilyticum]MDE5412923.1 DUF503 domain-containing protein [Alkalihalobacterium chitinilyticum]MEB1810131.1 DUF503 domain-containing protein [Bacillaceae bacterium]